MTRSRRRLLRTGAVAGVLAFAGCTESNASGAGDEDDPEGDGSTPTGTATSAPGPTGTTGTTTDGPASTDASGASTPTPTRTTSPTDDALDLREANVVGVSVETDAGGVRFDVTLYHDDDGEDGYANWWQVESLDGERLGRRELSHAHGTREFTRSATVSVPDGTTCVVVRGHDETHGYGGRAALVALDSGAVRPVDQGPDPGSFDVTDCP
jgi:hypothetical protein